MAHVDIMKTYRLELTPEEFRLVCNGLRALRSIGALELNRDLCERVHKSNAMALERTAHILQSATDECDENAAERQFEKALRNHPPIVS